MAAVEMALTTGRNNILASCHQVPRAWLSATLVRVDIPSPHQASFERRNVLLALARLVVVGDGVTARNSWSLQVLHLPSAVQDGADEATFCLWQKRRCLLLRAVLQIHWGAFRARLRSLFSVRGAAGLVSSRLRLCLWVALVCCGTWPASFWQVSASFSWRASVKTSGLSWTTESKWLPGLDSRCAKIAAISSSVRGPSTWRINATRTSASNIGLRPITGTCR